MALTRMTSAFAAVGLLLMMAAQEKACPWLWTEKVEPVSASSPVDTERKAPEPPTIGQTLEAAVLGRAAVAVGGIRDKTGQERDPSLPDDCSRGRLSAWRLELVPGFCVDGLARLFVHTDLNAGAPRWSRFDSDHELTPRDPAVGTTITSLAPPAA